MSASSQNSQGSKIIGPFNDVDHPRHYCQGKFEVIDVIEDWKLDYHLGNAIKYIARCEHKGDLITDLKKAIWYLRRRIDNAMSIEEKGRRDHN